LVLENDGSVLAAAITAAGLALMDGCIPMYDVIVATSLVCYIFYIVNANVVITLCAGNRTSQENY